METARKIVAAIVGILIIIAVVLLAKWIGDKVRQRYFQPQSVPAVTTVPQAPSNPLPPTTATTTNTATYSAIPSTGPREEAYFLFAFLALAGLATLRIAAKANL